MTALCIFAGASAGNDPDFNQQARNLGSQLARQGYTLVYGGGRTGMMGAFADGAITGGGEVIGIIPQFLEDREIAHADISQLVITNSMHERKARMYQGSAGFIILPGGLGTLDETMEVMTWIQLGLLQARIFLLDLDNYWQPLADMLDHIVARGFMHSAKLDFVHHARDVGEMMKLLEQHCPAS